MIILTSIIEKQKQQQRDHSYYNENKKKSMKTIVKLHGVVEK